MKFNELLKIFIQEVNCFSYELKYYSLLWDIIFADTKGLWYNISVIKRDLIYYITHVDGDTCTLEYNPKKHKVTVSKNPFEEYNEVESDPTAWTTIIKASLEWFKEVKNDWIKSYKYIHKNYPLNRKYGTINSKFIRGILEDYYCMNKELGNDKVNQFIKIVESKYFENQDKFILKDMTANDYFNFCKIAYIAYFSDVEYFDKNLSGYEMYQNFSDGRHNGLLDINFESKNEFREWLDKKHPKFEDGGHPWEIIKGYSSININMFVERINSWNNSGYRLRISASESRWIVAAVKMFLALHNAGVPTSLNAYNEIRKRLLECDNIGIVPEYESTSHARSNFSKDDDVYEIIHYYELENHKQKLTPFINWKPLPIFKPI